MSNLVQPRIARPLEEPNRFVLRGRRTSVSFSSTSLNGQPQVTFRDANGTQSFSGEQVRVEESAAGTLVSVVISDVPDEGSTTFTLVLPEVNLAGEPRPTIVAIGISTVRSTTIAGPPAGQTSSHSVIRLRGTAEHVVS